MNQNLYEGQAHVKKMQAEMNVKIENTEMAVNEKLKMHKNFINEIENKVKAKADL
jgi:predicted S18 family serine protease